MTKIPLLLGIIALATLGIGQSYSQSSSFVEINYAGFLDFCKKDTSLLWESMSIKERLLSNLCDFQSEGFDEKQWYWLNGTSLDWNNFAQMASNEYANAIPEFAESGIQETLRVDSFVSGRDSFPPPMGAMISFDYEKFSQIRHYSEKFTICMDGKLIPQDGFIRCTDEYVKYDFTNEIPFEVPQSNKKIPLPSDTKQQMQDWCQNSPKHVATSRQFWDVIPVRLVSDTVEFISFQGIKESFVANSNAVEQSCPPNVWMGGTFASKDGKRYKFALEYDSDYFRYQIDKKGRVDNKGIPNPHQQMKMGIPLYEIKCKEGFYPTFKIDRVTPACVTDKTLDKLLIRGWSPLRLGMPAETNILITYDAIQVYPHNVTLNLDPRSPDLNMVFWVNNDIVPHTIVAEDGSWSTGVIESGKIGASSFSQTGIYKYHVKERPSTVGIVEFSGLVDLDDE